jgi:predicted component of type VI protein secretion system
MAGKIFYRLPFRAEKLVQTDKDNHPQKLNEADKCDLATSVRQNLRLLLMTPPTQVRSDPDYGCLIHWAHFGLNTRLMTNGSRKGDDFKIKIEQNVRKLIEKFEPRIEVKEIVVTIKNAEYRKSQFFVAPQMKHSVLQIIVNVKGKVKEEFVFDGLPLEWENEIILL